jgi:nucleotide-binding universal stress UspA family protein
MPIDSTRNTRQKVPWTIEFSRMFPNTTIHVLGIHTTKNKTVRSEVEGYVHSVEKLLEKEQIRFTTAYIDAENTTLSTIDYANGVDADLSVIMTEQEKTLSNVFLGPYAQQMINHSHVPVLAVSVKQINGASR